MSHELIFNQHHHHQCIIVWKGFNSICDLFQKGEDKDVYARVVGDRGVGYVLLQGNKNTPASLDGSGLQWIEIVGDDLTLENGVPKWR